MCVLDVSNLSLLTVLVEQFKDIKVVIRRTDNTMATRKRTNDNLQNDTQTIKYQAKRTTLLCGRFIFLIN